MPRVRLPLLLLACLGTAPGLQAQGLASLARFNGRTELEGGAPILDITATDAASDTRVSLTASASVLQWDDGQGSVRVHADALLGVDRWRWTAGPVVDFEDAARPGAGLRLSGGYEIFPHATVALAFEALTAPRDSDGRSAGTHGSLGLMVRVAF